MLDIPTVPAAIMTVLGFFAPYAIALVNEPNWKPGWKRVVAIIVSLLLAAVALVIYFYATGEPIPDWWMMLFLCVLVTQASHSLVTRETAHKLELATSSSVYAIPKPSAKDEAAFESGRTRKVE